MDGAATIVAVGGEIAFNETIGYADRADETLLRHDSVFPVFFDLEGPDRSLRSCNALSAARRDSIRRSAR